jgi:enoyl-CoA hydratase
MMNYNTLIFELQKDIGIVKFNRPKQLNAINEEMIDEMEDLLNKIPQEVKVLILTGQGKAFIAGADISYLAKLSPLEARRFVRKGQELFFKIEALPIPVIACVNGFALGGGLEIAMSCDFIYCSKEAKLGQPEVNLGIMPGFGGTQRLSRLVGKAVAKELCMTGRIISADEAKELGIVNKVFPKESLWDETMKVANEISNKGRISLRAIKRTIDRGFDLDLRSGCYMEADNFALCFASPDAKEGLNAFLEKRTPQFKGKLI